VTTKSVEDFAWHGAKCRRQRFGQRERQRHGFDRRLRIRVSPTAFGNAHKPVFGLAKMGDVDMRSENTLAIVVTGAALGVLGMALVAQDKYATFPATITRAIEMGVVNEQCAGRAEEL